MAHLSGLGYGAVPYLAELTDDADPDVTRIANNILTDRSCPIQDFRRWNYSKANAEKILERYSALQVEVLPG